MTQSLEDQLAELSSTISHLVKNSSKENHDEEQIHHFQKEISQLKDKCSRLVHFWLKVTIYY